MNNCELSILVLGYNQRTKVLRLLRGIEQQRFDEAISFEVIYSDDGSTDNTIPTLITQSFCYSFKIADPNPKHESRAAARNRAAKLANGEWLLFLDGDGELNDRFVQSLWRAREMGEVRLAALAVHPDAFCPARRYEVLRSPAYRYGSKSIPQRLLQSGCFLIERRLFWLYGAFDERLTGRSGEDVALGAKLAAAEVPISAVPDAIFFHDHHRTMSELFEVKRKYAAQGLPRMIAETPELYYAARLHWLFDPKQPLDTTGIRGYLKRKILNLPVEKLCRIAEYNFNFWWSGRTIIPLLAFAGTMQGWHDYLTSQTITEEDAG